MSSCRFRTDALNFSNDIPNKLGFDFYRPQGEGNVFTSVCLFTIGLMATGSLLILVTAWSVGILLECFLVFNKNVISKNV